jgi:uncharacterized repeat protein (TIGR03803 family)
MSPAGAITAPRLLRARRQGSHRPVDSRERRQLYAPPRRSHGAGAIYRIDTRGPSHCCTHWRHPKAPSERPLFRPPTAGSTESRPRASGGPRHDLPASDDWRLRTAFSFTDAGPARARGRALGCAGRRASRRDPRRRIRPTSASCTGFSAPSTLTVLHDFGAAAGAGRRNAPVTQAIDGFLYGTTSAGGPFGRGTIFPAVTRAVFDFEHIHGFVGADESVRRPLLQASDGRLLRDDRRRSDRLLRDVLLAGASAGVHVPPRLRRRTAFEAPASTSSRRRRRLLGRERAGESFGSTLLELRRSSFPPPPT